MHPGVKSWKNLVVFAYNFFCIPLLVKTLFTPFQNDKPNKNFDIFETIVFFIFSRILGFAIRMVLIVVGLVFTFLMILTFPLFFFVPIKIDKETLRDMGSIGSELSYGITFYLNKHTHDLLSMGNIRLFGKDKVLRMIERSLDKDSNRNVLLVGETGVGKSLILSYLGRLGRSGLSFPGIAHHRVIGFEPQNIEANAFIGAMNEANEAGNIILAIENIHEYQNLFTDFIPYLDKKNLGIIATTDFYGYDKVLKMNPEFSSHFTKIDMFPSTDEETYLILKNHIAIKRVKITEEAILELIKLTNRYMTNEPQPLKSLLVLEELRSLGGVIDIKKIQEIISDKTNMQIGDLDVNEKNVLQNLESFMKEKVIGQDEAVTDVVEAMKRLRTGIADPNKPAGSFLFLGPTGVGKTYTAKILAESYFGHKNAMIRFDMSEFSMPDSISIFSDRLGATVEETPLALVFFDEIEKAHRNIHQLFLQILDEGHLTRENGRMVNFKNTIIIATTNAQSRSIIENPNIEKKVLINRLIEDGNFAPEFLNRFSDVILFKPLGEDGVRKVAELLLKEFQVRLFEDKGLNLEITPALVDKIATAGFDPLFGARPIHRAIEEIVENKIADYLISGNKEKNIKII